MTLSAENFHQLYIPPGCAHGFCVLSEVAEVQYKCAELYDPSDEVGSPMTIPTTGDLVAGDDAGAVGA